MLVDINLVVLASSSNRHDIEAAITKAITESPICMALMDISVEKRGAELTKEIELVPLLEQSIADVRSRRRRPTRIKSRH